MNFKGLLPAVALASLQLSAAPSISISTPTTSRDLPIQVGSPAVFSLVKENYTVKLDDLKATCESSAPDKIKFNKAIPFNCFDNTSFEIKIRFAGDYQFSLSDDGKNVVIKRQPKKSKTVFKRPLPNVKCLISSGESVSIQVADVFEDGVTLIDAISQQEMIVSEGHVTLVPSKNSGGLVLLEEKAQQNSEPFSYKNANVYFVMVDRFKNGNPDNDNSYDRKKDSMDEVGTFHGGDLQGVISQLDYIQSLGTSVIWLSPIVEQVHGFVGGGKSGSFPFYAYHGYWTRDFTKIDENFGNDDELKTLIDEAHKRGMKVILDAVVNHAGYATMADMQNIAPNVINAQELPEKWIDWAPQNGQDWHTYNQFFDGNHSDWKNWWGPDWIRANYSKHTAPGSNAMTLNLAGLPDFITESEKFVSPPKWLLNNSGTRVVERENYRIQDYLIEWQTDWVKRFGVDGFRVDTVKHVNGDVWLALKDKAQSSLTQWKSSQDLDNSLPFWMIGEVWAHPATRSFYYDEGFDGLINFDMQKEIDTGAACFGTMEKIYADYSKTIQSSPDFNPVSYISSHDTELFFSRYRSFDMQKQAANALLLTPGAIQVYYGDEVGRDIGPYADDFHQGTRSDMVWKIDKDRQALLDHWKTVGQFRNRHPAIGAGTHQHIEHDELYVFSRTLNTDKVVVAFAGNESK